MTPTRGPTKKLAPSISSDRCCPHEWSEDDGLQLEVDCTRCPGANNLANAKCLSGVLKALASGGIPETIVLKSYIHKRYRGETVERASDIASELAALSRALVSASLDRPSDKRCRTCRASKEQLLGLLRRRILDDPVAYSADRTTFVTRLSSEIDTSSCDECERCIRTGLKATSPGSRWSA